MEHWELDEQETGPGPGPLVVPEVSPDVLDSQGSTVHATSQLPLPAHDGAEQTFVLSCLHDSHSFVPGQSLVLPQVTPVQGRSICIDLMQPFASQLITSHSCIYSLCAAFHPHSPHWPSGHLLSPSSHDSRTTQFETVAGGAFMHLSSTQIFFVHILEKVLFVRVHSPQVSEQPPLQSFGAEGPGGPGLPPPVVDAIHPQDTSPVPDRLFIPHIPGSGQLIDSHASSHRHGPVQLQPS